MNILQNIEPKSVMSFFEDICAIPHGSGNTKQISEYCLAKAREMGLEEVADGMNNVIIKKPASVGYENRPAVILQAHLDMVCEKKHDCKIDFEKDGLEIAVEGDFITANGTTLGGDDGIGVAMILAVLKDKNLAHPPIEALFTTDEETGMFGVAALDGSKLFGRKLINIDSEVEGVLTVSCAGGARAEIRLPAEKSVPTSPCYELIIDGLKGGHSGVEIHKGRHNSNMLMAELLKELKHPYNIIDIEGGSKDNAIPARTVCTVSTSEDIKAIATEFKNKKLTDEEPELEIGVFERPYAVSGFSFEASAKITEFLLSLPNGVQKMSEDIKGLVQTSLNLGILKTEKSGIYLTFAVRSSVNDEKTELLSLLKSLTLNAGGEFEESGHYPAWEYRKNSPLRDTMVELFDKLYGKKPVVEAIHAGLECGILSDKLPNLDAVSFGPDMEGIHTPAERLSVSSVERSYNYLCKVLENL